MKKFWHILKRTLLLASFLGAGVLFVLVLTSAAKKQNERTCSGLTVHVDYESGLAFLSKKEIAEKIGAVAGGSVAGRRLTSLNLRQIEAELRKNPFVDNAEIFSDQSAMLHALVTQKRPVARVLNHDGIQYYISDKNERMPLNERFVSRVPVILGFVDMHQGANRDSLTQENIFDFVSLVRRDTFLNALIDQIYVFENGELELVPKTGGHTILFGKHGAESSAKFESLKTFYTQGLPKSGWNKYKTINLKFENQVVCVKRDTIQTQ